MPRAEMLFRTQCAEAIAPDGTFDPQRLIHFILKTYRRQRAEISTAHHALIAAHARNVNLTHDIAMLSQAVAEKNQVIDAVLEHLPLGLCIFDEQQRLTIFNHRFRELFNFREEDMRPGTSITALLSRVAGREVAAGRTVRGDPRSPSAADGTKIRRRDWRMDDGRQIESTVTILPDGSSVSLHEDVTEERRAAEQITYIAHHDPLTGLYNRIRFRDEVDIALERLIPGERMALIHLNLDNFKSINNTLGVTAGDQVLQQVANRLRSNAGSSNILARLGSDEFAILQCGRQQPLNVRALIDQIRRELAAPFVVGDTQVELTVSAGIAIAPDDGSETGVLLKNASVALSHAKADGRRRHRFFAAEMEGRIQLRHALEADLRRAIKQQEFELHYQPLYDVIDSRIVGFEALLRWNHPERGRVSPLDFIPLAEELGLITDIGRWVLQQACRDAAQWPGTIKVAVNVSAIQFRTGDFPADVLAAVAAANLSPSRLEIEITESVLMQHLDETVPALHALRNSGIRIAMDDFGTGYSSLSYLRSFPFQKIKIDRSFVSDIAESPPAQAIMRAMILLGKALGMRVTAEGVETARQFEMLRDEGCDEIQGYFISPPRPFAEVAQLLSSPVLPAPSPSPGRSAKTGRRPASG
ncbi:MAG: EAL domain-containing protein [Rhizobium sp.]